MEPPFDFTYFETDVQVAAGGAYYYAINVKNTTGGVVTAMMLPANLGTGMAPKGGGISFATYKLTSLAPAMAAAEMAKLDAQATLEAQFR